MFASEWMDGGVRPDILVCAKGIANGFPLSAVATRHELSVKQTPGIFI
jgi:4-aminobutyrate aminotransferase